MTILQQACRDVPGFEALYNKIIRRMKIEDRAMSTCNNYCRCLAHLGLYYKALPTELSVEQIEDYLLELKNTRSDEVANSFKFTIYGLKYAYRVDGRSQLLINLPRIRHKRKLPVVLSKEEVLQMINRPYRLKHRLLIALLYGCGLRLNEVRNLLIEDIDLDRSVLFVRNSKNRKDRYLPLGRKLTEMLRHYLKQQKPKKWLLPGYRWKGPTHSLFLTVYENQYGKRSVQWAIKHAAKLAGIKKPVNVHSLRHTFATHLLEEGVNILTIQEMLGHVDIKTTMVYLHVAQVDNRQRRSPLDSLEGVEVISRLQTELPF